jgi:hypothetical protein
MYTCSVYIQAYFDTRRWESSPVGGADVLAHNISWSATCPGYDSWEYGLQTGPELKSAPYVQDALATAGSSKALAARYAARDVVYLAGAMDMCNVTKGWCNSHGLETTCTPLFFFLNQMHLVFMRSWVGVHTRMICFEDVHRCLPIIQ